MTNLRVGDPATARKDSHIEIARAQQQGFSEADESYRDFDDITFVHHGLRGTGSDAVSLATEVAGIHWDQPLYVNAMTGGTGRSYAISRELAQAACVTGTALACGSMSSYLGQDSEALESFFVLRETNPDGFIFANVNANTSPEHACQAVDLLDANALQIHLNSAQELMMPEGDRDFRAWPDNIARMVEAVSVPVVVKEVGSGISGDTYLELATLGVSAVDVSGRGAPISRQSSRFGRAIPAGPHSRGGGCRRRKVWSTVVVSLAWRVRTCLPPAVSGSRWKQ